MKVIGRSNFDNESVSDILVAVGLSRAEAESIAKTHNEPSGEYSTYIYVVVEDDHKLYEFEP